MTAIWVNHKNSFDIFSRTAAPEQCPDCGKYALWPANEAERQEYEKRLKEPGEIKMAYSSQRERITQYIWDTYGTQAEYLWADSPGNAIFRHPASKKWYAALMCFLPEKLGLAGEEVLDVMDIKCSTIMIGSLLSTRGFLPAYHMNKNHWISIILDNSVSDDQITPLLEWSYDSVAPKRWRKRPQSEAE